MSRQTPDEPRAGIVTSEFFVAVGIIIVATALVAFGELDDAAWSRWVDVTKWAGGGYVVSRGIAKINR